jgi:NifU-like protein involved in Fe-S cluster formation
MLEAGTPVSVSQVLLEHLQNPRHVGVMLDADGHAVTRGECGDSMEVFLRLDKGESIRVAAFMTDGCPFTHACGSMMTLMAEGKSLIDAASVEAKELIDAFGGLPADHEHCARLAVKALRAAVSAYMNARQQEAG